ncbi:MAG: DEAD/DEAH box helicase [Nocardioidaceae bacterium]
MSTPTRRDGLGPAPGRTTLQLIGVPLWRPAAPSLHASALPNTAEDTPVTGSASFADLGLPAVLVNALATVGIDTPFPIQSATLTDSLAGRDVLGRGRTGSGKTYAFALPVLARLAASASPRRPNRPRALILAPTRELAGSDRGRDQALGQGAPASHPHDLRRGWRWPPDHRTARRRRHRHRLPRPTR